MSEKAYKAYEDHDACNCNDESLSGFVGRGARFVVRDDDVAAGYLKYIAAVGARPSRSPNLSRANLLSAWNGGGLI